MIFDAHLDLSMNAMEWNRDLRLPIDVIRAREKGMTDKPDRSNATVCFPELRKGNILLVVATQIARYVAPGNPLPGWASPEQAWAHTRAQRAWYREMEFAGELKLIHDRASLEFQLALLAQPTGNYHPIGFLLSLEGADSLVTLKHLETAWNDGLRAIGPAHYGPGRYANGTDAAGPLHPAGKELLKEMDSAAMILDVTHFCDESFWDAIEMYKGPVWASHNNCRALVQHNRQFDDEQLKVLIERGAVIGSALDAWMMVPGWKKGQSTPREMQCNLEVLVDHMDHICQLAGNADHIGIGSDLDGAFGKEQCPYDVDTIADLQNLEAILAKRGYKKEDIEKVMHGNWIRFLRTHLR